MGRSLKLARAAAVVSTAFAMARPVQAQGAANLVAAGDSAYAQRHVREALDDYRKAIAADSTDYPAHVKASRSEVDIAETAKGADADSLMAVAQRHAEAAVKLRPNDAEGHFALARAIGRKALSVGVMDRIRFSKIIRAEALEALKADSLHPGALHVLGMWNAEILRVNGLARTFARTFLGAQIFSLANWDDAQRLLETAVRVDPKRMVHRLDLGSIYADRGQKEKAREMFNWIASAPIVEPNDDLYKKQAAERLKKL